MTNQYKYIDNDPDSYVRVQGESEFHLDSNTKEDLDGMEKQGKQFWDKDKHRIMKLVKAILDEKLGAAAVSLEEN